MKRTILLLVTIVSIFFSVLTAAPIERSTALQYAKQFLNQTSVPQLAPGKVPASLLESVPTYTAEDTVTGTPLYYVYNLSNDVGFVIVAADTRVRTILGYSFNGNFDENNIPINMREWLDEYSSQIAYAIKEIPESHARTTTIARSPAVNNAVAPLLGDIKYNQGAPYNNLCPMDDTNPDDIRRSVTGCVATAMAQVMRYHKHPQVGKGTKTYTTATLNQQLTVDFSSTYYDWDNMLPSYVGTSTDVQKTAIATLMYHAGVAAEMDYSADGSGANTPRAVRAMYEYFDYDIGLDRAQRKYYSAGEWLQLIKSEIDQARPIIYSGRTPSSGHAFVCDGYDADNFVHINWGWGGYQDGYFQLSALDPEGGGIGAGSGGYNLEQSIFYGIQKPVQGSVASGSMIMVYGINVNKNSITGTETAQFEISDFRAASLFGGFIGQAALALYDEVGNFVKIIDIGNINLDVGYYYPSFTFSNISVSDIRPDVSTIGTYYIKPVCRAQGEVNWKPVLSTNEVVKKIKADITATSINFEVPEMTFTLSEAASAVIKNSPNAIFYGNNLNVELQILNTGNVEYRAQIGVKAVSLANESNKYEIATVKTILPVGETTTVNLGGLIDFPVGEYKLEAYYDATNTENDFSFPQTKIGSEIPATQFTVVAAPSAYSLSLTKSNEMPVEIEQGTPFTFKATIKNTGGLYAGDLVLEFLEGRSDGYYYYIGKPKTHYVEILTETKEVVIECALDLPVGSDYVALLNYTNYTSGKTVPIEDTYENLSFFSVKAKPIIQVSANPAEGGTVTGGGSVASGTSHTVTATANAGYVFKNWTENGAVVSTEPSYTFTVNADRELVANFIVSNFRTKADGNWENPATWQFSSDKITWENATVVPTADAASISVEHAITVNTPISDVSNLTVKSGATLIGDISGQATVEQAAENHHTYYIGSPVSGTNVGSDNIGASITFTENEGVEGTWSAVAAFSTIAPVFGKGYGVQVGKDNTGLTTISFTGTLNNGEQTILMTAAKRRFNFLGNPYPSYLSGTEIVKDANKVEKTIWTYFKDTDDNYKFGFYNLSEANTGSLMSDGNIPPMQGFWVKAKEQANFTFDNNMRIHKPTTATNTFRTPQASERQALRLEISNGASNDEAIILFSENADKDWNSTKLMNAGLNIYTVKAGENLALNSRTAIEYDVEIPVGVKAASDTYTISAVEFENFGTEKAYLLDKVANVVTDLSSGNYTVNFTDAYEGTDRFALVFPRSGIISGLERGEVANFFAYANNNRIIVNCDAEAGVIYVFNGLGQQVATQTISGKLTTLNTLFPAGVYLIKLNNQTTKVVVK